jgi:hypothetical protein
VQSRLVLVLAVVAATVTAGCVAVGGPFGFEQRETLTPVDVTSPTPPSTQSETDSQRPDTATTDTDANAGSRDTLSDIIVARHSAALNDSSFRLSTAQRIVVNGSTVQRTTYNRTVASGWTAYVATFNRTHNDYPRNVTISDIDAYYNGTVAATRYQTVDDSRVRYTFRRNPVVRIDDLAAQRQIRQFLRAYDVQRQGNTSGTPETVVRAERISAPTAIPSPIETSRPRNGTLSMTVRSDGIVTFTRIEYTVTVGENRIGRVVRTIRIDEIGRVTVDRPSWVETAAEAAETS